jgi:hypothetical protein
VLIDGGVHRIFKEEDKRTFEEDFCAIKAEVVSRCNELDSNCTVCSFFCPGC